MYINLPFKILWFTYIKAVYIVLNIGVLEDICDNLKLEFHEINEFIRKDANGFSQLLMYYGYLAGCKAERRRPKYTLHHSTLWAKKISLEESAKLLILMSELYGKLTPGEPVDVKKKS